MRLFDLVRDVDVTGKSGTGVVAQGVEFDDLTVAMRWVTPLRSTTLFDHVARLEAIHGHDGLTRIVWWDERTDDKRPGVKQPGSPIVIMDDDTHRPVEG